MNASCVPSLAGASRASTYIVSQAPPPDTFGAFFHHLHAQRVQTLVNLTPLAENGIRKSERYWPLATAPVTSGAWRVDLLGETERGASADRACVRQLRLTHADGASHELQQIHFTGWQDHGELDPAVLVSLLNAIQRDKGAVWVHCSAGIGRSGTLVGALLAQELDLKSSSGSAMELAARTTAHMRQYRMGMVQTPGQLLTLARVIEVLRAAPRAA